MTEGVAVQGERASHSQAPQAVAVLARGLRREYGDLVALRDVSFELPSGQTLTVLGPNGAGKTTLLRILATLLRPTAGDVSVLGEPLPAAAWRVRGRLGFVGHQPLLYRDLTVAENLRFQARLHGLGDPEPRIAELLERTRLARRARELVRNLSAGMLQRAAICRAVLHQPGLLLLDEPRAHLDPQAAALVEPLIGSGAARSRVLVTHDVEAGLAEGDRVLLLGEGGAVAYEGRAEGLSAGDARAAYGMAS